MDITFFSFVMAFITSSILILLIYFLTKNKKLDTHMGLTSIVILYVCSVVRLAFPFEFPNKTIIISDTVVYPVISDFLFSPIIDTRANRFEPVTTVRYIDVLAVILTVVTVFLLLRQAYKFYNFIRLVGSYTNLATNREQRVFEETIKESHFKRKIRLKVIDEKISPMTYGVINPVVLIPINDYTDRELRYIFRHELTHQKNNDPLIKLLVELYCCIFWWNPFVYLLKANLAQKLELKCDYKTTVGNTEQEKLEYLDAIVKCMKNCSSKEMNNSFSVKCSLVNLELFSSDDADFTKERFEYILNISDKKSLGKKINITLAFACAAILALSYMFIWQPSGGGYVPPEAYREDEKNWIISDASNSYLVKQEDGSYIFIFNGKEFDVSKEDVDNGLYFSYPIKEK